MKRILPVALCAILGFTGCDKKPPAPPPPSSSHGAHGSAAETTSAAKENDPVCGMDVDPATALWIEKDGKRFYFCSDDCKVKFEKDPTSFITEPKEGGGEHGGHDHGHK